MSSLTNIKGKRTNVNSIKKIAQNAQTTDVKVGADISSAESVVINSPELNIIDVTTTVVTSGKLPVKSAGQAVKSTGPAVKSAGQAVKSADQVVNLAVIDVNNSDEKQANVATKQIRDKIRIQPPETAQKDSTIYNMYQKLGNTINIVGYQGRPCLSFADMDLTPELIQAIQTVMRWEFPSPIQSVGIAPLINGNDLFCQSQTGTGKTGTYLIAILRIIEMRVRKCQAIVLVPTRELAVQIYEVAHQLATFMDVNIACHTGTAIPIKKDKDGKEIKDGTTQRVPRSARKFDDRGVDYLHNVKPDNSELKTYSVPAYSEHLVIATPGKLWKLINDGTIDTTSTKLIVLDEADKILDHGFMTNVIDIFSRVPDDINIALYSATLSHEIKNITTQFMVKPVYISVATENVVLDNQIQYIVKTETPENKEQMLINIFGSSGVGQVMVFTNRKFMADHVKEFIKNLGITVEVLHSDIEPEVRNTNMTLFKEGKIKVLVCSDVAARGIDTVVDLVINYDIPQDVDQFVHRSGRTGRFGRTGSVINFVSNDDEKHIKKITAYYSIRMTSISQFFENRGAISHVL
jgi:superfamily II DNA/RNA helicase